MTAILDALFNVRCLLRLDRGGIAWDEPRQLAQALVDGTPPRNEYRRKAAT